MMRFKELLNLAENNGRERMRFEISYFNGEWTVDLWSDGPHVAPAKIEITHGTFQEFMEKETRD